MSLSYNILNMYYIIAQVKHDSLTFFVLQRWTLHILVNSVSLTQMSIYYRAKKKLKADTIGKVKLYFLIKSYYIHIMKIFKTAQLVELNYKSKKYVQAANVLTDIV